MLSNSEMKQKILSVLGKGLPENKIVHSSISFEKDFDDQPIVRFLVRYERPVLPGKLIELSGDIRAELIKVGDDRYVFLEQEYQDDSGYDDEEDAPKRIRAK